MQYEIRNRWTGDVKFTAEIDATDDTLCRLKIGLAVKWAVKIDANLRGAVLSGADLRDADLSGAVLSGAVLSGADLRYANLIGANLSRADLSDANLSDANLSYAKLSDANLSRANLSRANLSDANLSRADLIGANLRDANLSDANLSRANLRGADWIPVIPNIHASVYAVASAEGALDMGAWHQNGFCGTTHCRAGWVTHLAGDAGRVMDGIMGTAAAAALIYAKSDPQMERVPSFYASSEAALADMKRLADAEVAS